jgi:hypothetical protein
MDQITGGRVISFILFTIFIILNIIFSLANLYPILFLTVSINLIAVVTQLYSLRSDSRTANAASWFLLGGSTIVLISLTQSSYSAWILFAWIPALLGSADLSHLTLQLQKGLKAPGQLYEDRYREITRLLFLKYRRVAFTSMVTFLFSAVIYNLLPVIILPNPAAGTAVFGGAVLILILSLSFDWRSKGLQATSDVKQR